MDSKQLVFEEREDHTIVRLKHPRLTIKVEDVDCTPKELERAFRALYEWMKHCKGSDYQKKKEENNYA